MPHAQPPARCIAPATRHVCLSILFFSSFVRESTGVSREAWGLIQGHPAGKQDSRGTAWGHAWLLVELMPGKTTGFLIPRTFSDQTDTLFFKEILGSPWPRGAQKGTEQQVRKEAECKPGKLSQRRSLTYVHYSGETHKHLRHPLTQGHGVGIDNSFNWTLWPQGT